MNIPSKIMWRLHLNSSPDRVYKLLTTAEGLADFWCESATEVGNGEIILEFVDGTREQVRIHEQTPNARLVVSYFNSRVEFELQPDGSGGTDLTVTNTGFDPDEYDDILPGWLNVLFPLKAFADFGVDLRTHDPQRTWSRGYVNQ